MQMNTSERASIAGHRYCQTADNRWGRGVSDHDAIPMFAMPDSVGRRVLDIQKKNNVAVAGVARYHARQCGRTSYPENRTTGISGRTGTNL
ncbi:hypothetical protein MRX96_036915 [Rhipicephalus microplus]